MAVYLILLCLGWKIIPTPVSAGTAAVSSSVCDTEDEPACRRGESGNEESPHMALLQQKRSPVSKTNLEAVRPANGTRSMLAVQRGHETFPAAPDAVSTIDAGLNHSITTQICGTRPLFPQLQFELEVFRTLGLVESSYARCRVPSIRLLALEMPLGGGMTLGVDTVYSSIDAMMITHFPALEERRGLVAEGIAIAFAVTALLTLCSYAHTVYTGGKTDVAVGDEPQTDFGAIHAVWKRGSVQWVAPFLSWLDPIIGRYCWARVASRRQTELKTVEPDDHLSTYSAFRNIWQEELKIRGAGRANLLRSVANLLGHRVFLWMLITTGTAVLLEVAGVTVVLDMLLNYLHLARAVRLDNPAAVLDHLRPVIMFISLGFLLPMLARIFHNAASLCDTHYADRITTGLLTAIYEKSQRSSFYSEREHMQREVEILTTDTRHMWTGALSSFANLMVYPPCMVLLVAFLVQHLGQPAVLGAMSTCWVVVLYIPVRVQLGAGQRHWGHLASSWLDLLQEAVANMRTLKATVWEGPFSERIRKLRDDELQAKFQLSLLQIFLDVPFSVLPFALIASSLFFCYLWNGGVQLQDLFVCMQVLSGFACCLPPAVAAARKFLSLAPAAQRVQLFLQEPEPRPDTLRRPFQDASAPHVQVQGSFAVAEGLPPVLKDVDVQIRRGELVAVVGEVASGKSALLSAIRGELPGADVDAFVQAPQKAIFCSQEPWVVDGTLQENIMLDEPKDLERLYDALESAAMLKDKEELLVHSEAANKDAEDASAKQSVSQEHKRRTVQGAAPHILEPEIDGTRNKFPYFAVWNTCAIFAFVFGIYNVDWRKTPVILGVLISIVQGILHWSVLEFPIQTLATLTKPKRKLAKADASNATVILNYNVLATSQGDVDECMENMLEAYLCNLHENVSATLISATNDTNLQQYELQVRNDHRARIYKEVYKSGLCFAGFAEGGGPMHEAWLKRVWPKYEQLDKHEFVQNLLGGVCERFCQEYMVIHRTTRVLRKCGQYQDLILLSQGEDTAFTYCDRELYHRAARKEGEPLFRPTEDSANICGRNHDYTLVLDSDTRVEPGAVHTMLQVACAYPEKAIFQPTIRMDCGPEDSIFMHLEAMRQRVYAPMNSTMTTLLGKSAFFGKGLIKNSVYAKYCLGTRDQPVESVPIDVLSHDTFEAAVLNPIYLADVHLLEAPCHNYITWDIRERRWNLGEMLLAMYFWPRGVGQPVRWLQKRFQGEKKFNQVQVRTQTRLDKVSSYFAHSALRQMVLKPMLLLYLVMMHFVEMKWKRTPFFVVMFSIIVFPKFATCYRHNYKDVLLETWASLLQFTPEALVGTIRVLSAVKAHLAGAATWVPQRSVEEESKVSNPFIFSLRYLWYYSVFALIWGLRFRFWAKSIGPEAMFVMTILLTLFTLPVYVGFTALPANALTALRGQLQSRANPCTKILVHGEDVALQVFRLRLPKMKSQGVERAGAKARLAVYVNNATKLDVGCRGVRLSAAERSCLSLARAAYSKRSNLVLLDDPFSNVDEVTGMHIVEKLICGPLMRGRTRIVAMQPQLDLLKHFDRVLLMSKGRIVAQGTPAEVAATSEARELSSTGNRSSHGEPLQLAVRQPAAATAHSSPLKLIALADGAVDAARSRQDEMPELPDWRRVWAMLSPGAPQLGAALLALVVLRIAMQGQIIFLGRWADLSLRSSASTGYYGLVVFSVMVICLCQVLLGYSILHFNMQVSRHVFDRAFSALMKAPVDSYWHGEPIGRVMGRFAGNLLTVDSKLSGSVVAVVSVTLDLLVQQLYCCIVMPLGLQLPTCILVACFCRIFWNINSNLQLVSATTRLQCQEKQASMGKMARQSMRAFDYGHQMVAQFCSYAASMVMCDSVAGFSKVWAVTNLSLCLYFQCTLCLLVGILRPEQVGVGSLTIIITSTFYIVHQLDSLIDSLVDIISICLSLQSLSTYDRLPQEAREQLPYDRQTQNRLAADGIGLCMVDVRVGYGKGGKDVLHGVSIDIPASAKALFLGGPGSGKSTALYCILRILELRQGKVTLNGVPTQTIGVHTLRNMIGFVPQDASVFRGTIRFNIDPMGQHNDEKIWAAVQQAQLLPAVQRFSQGINHNLADEGSNLSFGQRQLLSVARAICQQPPLLLLDECASALDPRTRRSVQASIVENFHKSTVIAATRSTEDTTYFDHVSFFDSGRVVQHGEMSQFLSPSAPLAPVVA